MPTFTQIGSAVVVGSGGAATISFTSIPSTYTDLCIKATMRTDRAATEDPVTITFNSGGTYSEKRLWANGTTATSYSGSTIEAQYADGATSTSNTFTNFELYIPNYTSTSNAKSLSYDSVSENNGNPAYAVMLAGLWTKSPQEAISSITFDPVYGNFVQYSTAYLYGVSNA
jgi:hypothetical protein